MRGNDHTDTPTAQHRNRNTQHANLKTKCKIGRANLETTLQYADDSGHIRTRLTPARNLSYTCPSTTNTRTATPLKIESSSTYSPLYINLSVIGQFHTAHIHAQQRAERRVTAAGVVGVRVCRKVRSTGMASLACTITLDLEYVAK